MFACSRVQALDNMMYDLRDVQRGERKKLRVRWKALSPQSPRKCSMDLRKYMMVVLNRVHVVLQKSETVGCITQEDILSIAKDELENLPDTDGVHILRGMQNLEIDAMEMNDNEVAIKSRNWLQKARVPRSTPNLWVQLQDEWRYLVQEHYSTLHKLLAKTKVDTSKQRLVVIRQHILRITKLVLTSPP